MIQGKDIGAYWKKLSILILSIIGCIVLGYVLLVCAYSIPTERMAINLKESTGIFVEEGTYPQKIKGYMDSRLDNWTDSLMLLTAVHETEESAFRASALNARNIISGKNPCESLVQIYGNNDESKMEEVTYGRYWHGYLVILKTLLLFFDYGEIRYISMLVQLMLFVVLAMLLSRRGRSMYIWPLVVSWLFLNPIATMLSMQFSVITLITFGQIIVMLVLEKKFQENSFCLCRNFLLLGCVVNYFDLLTYPLVALGIPLAYWMSINISDRRKDVFKEIGDLVKYGLAWSCGYGGMWVGKWLLGSLVSGENIIKDAINQVTVRTDYSASQEEFLFGDLLKRLCTASNELIICIALISLILIIVTEILRKNFRVSWNGISVCFIIGIMPFVWYAVLGNHSWIHFWFAYREFVILINVLLMTAVGWIQSKKGLLDTKRKGKMYE